MCNAKTIYYVLYLWGKKWPVDNYHWPCLRMLHVMLSPPITVPFRLNTHKRFTVCHFKCFIKSDQCVISHVDSSLWWCRVRRWLALAWAVARVKGEGARALNQRLMLLRGCSNKPLPFSKLLIVMHLRYLLWINDVQCIWFQHQRVTVLWRLQLGLFPHSIFRAFTLSLIGVVHMQGLIMNLTPWWFCLPDLFACNSISICLFHFYLCFCLEYTVLLGWPNLNGWFCHCSFSLSVKCTPSFLSNTELRHPH